jgi:hypothetical protein
MAISRKGGLAYEKDIEKARNGRMTRLWIMALTTILLT